MELECLRGFSFKRSLANMGKVSTKVDGKKGHSRPRKKES